MSKLVAGIGHKNPGVRYWSVTGLASLAHRAVVERTASKQKKAQARQVRRKLQKAKVRLRRALKDRSECIRIAAAETLYFLGDERKALSVLGRPSWTNSLPYSYTPRMWSTS